MIPLVTPHVAKHSTGDVRQSGDSGLLVLADRLLAEQPNVYAPLLWWSEGEEPEFRNAMLMGAAVVYGLLRAQAEVDELERMHRGEDRQRHIKALISAGNMLAEQLRIEGEENVRLRRRAIAAAAAFCGLAVAVAVAEVWRG